MNAPLRPGTRPVGAAQLAVKDTSTDGPVFAATPPRVTARGPKTGAARCAYKRGAVHVGAKIENSYLLTDSVRLLYLLTYLLTYLVSK